MEWTGVGVWENRSFMVIEARAGVELERTV
jgi:hypothetical protein